jgi:hypothetical protein
MRKAEILHEMAYKKIMRLLAASGFFGLSPTANAM